MVLLRGRMHLVLRHVLPLLALAVAAAPVAAARALDDCRRRLEPAGPTEQAAECYFEVAWEVPSLRAVAKRELDELIGRYPEAGWLHYFRGRIPPWWVEGGPYIRRAAELFAQQGQVSAEIRARANLVTLHGFAAEHPSADAEAEFRAAQDELERIGRLAESSSLPEDRAIFDLAQAHYRILKGAGLGEAYSLLLDAERILSQAPPSYYHDLKDCFRALIHVTTELGIAWGPEIWARKAEQAALARGSLRDLAAASHNVVDTQLRSDLPSDQLRSELAARLQRTLAMAQESGHDWVAASSRHLLAVLEGGVEARAHLDSCVATARDIDDPKLRCSCMLSLATHTLSSAPVEARRLLEVAHAGESSDLWTFLDGWADQMRVLWATAPRDEALEQAQTILAAIERLRRDQGSDASDLVLSEWADPYYWLSGRLLEGAPETADIGLSFAILERLRAQTLREALAAPDPSSGSRPSDLAQQAAELRKEFSAVYRGLLDPALGPGDRQALRERLTELERIENRLNRRLLVRPVLAPPAADLLDRVRAALADDEALLSYQLGMWEGWDRRFLGGSWLTMTTRGGTRVYRLEGDAATFGRRVRALLRLDDPERPAALARLHADLIGPALSELPSTVRKLVVIPDGYLHLLPFSLLRASETAEPLIQRFEIQIIPSASIWLDWKATPTPATAAARQALVLANPELAAARTPSGTRGELDSVYALGPLPYAEREGRLVLRRLGGRGRLESGAEASESFLKTVDLGVFDVVHFAAHAISNPSKPDRSAVMLAAGSGEEDGFLRPSEIARLQGLEGKLVVLAACNSARGHILRGEGVLSLARPFFQAGAHAVVASLWRLDDRQATEFFDDFYERIRHGSSVGRALADTQRAWSAAGRPATTWAGLVVLGNGDLVPIPGGVEGDPRRAVVAIALVVALALMVLVLARDFRSRSR